MKKIFFARGGIDYGTEYEQIWIKEIFDAFSLCKILEFPSDDMLEKWRIEEKGKNPDWIWSAYKEEIKFFFPLIDQCDIMIAAPIHGGGKRKDTGKFSLLVALEIEYALIKGKRVVGLVGNEMKNIELKDIKDYTKRIMGIRRY